MKKALAGTAWCASSPIRYYLLTEQDSRNCGVLVEYRDEAAAVPGVASRQRTMDLLRLLRQGRVTPVTAMDVIEDWLADSACNFSGDSV